MRIYKNLKMADRISFLSIKIFVEVSIARYEKMVKIVSFYNHQDASGRVSLLYAKNANCLHVYNCAIYQSVDQHAWQTWNDHELSNKNLEAEKCCMAWGRLRFVREKH
jgi:hypothetical protein